MAKEDKPVSIIDDDPQKYKYAPYEEILDKKNVVNIGRGEAHGIFTSGMTDCVALACFMKDKNGVTQRMSMVHLPGGIGSSQLEDDAIMNALLKNAPKGGKVEFLVGWSTDQYDTRNDFTWLNRGKTLVGEHEQNAFIAAARKHGLEIESITVHTGARNNLDKSAFTFGANFNGLIGEFKNCHGLQARKEQDARIQYDESPKNPDHAVFLLQWAERMGDKERWNQIQKEIKTLTSEDFSQAKSMTYNFTKNDLPLKDTTALKAMMEDARKHNRPAVWAQIKDAMVSEIKNAKPPGPAVAQYKELLQMHYKKDEYGDYKGSKFCRMFQGGETAHWRQVKKFEGQGLQKTDTVAATHAQSVSDRFKQDRASSVRDNPQEAPKPEAESEHNVRMN